MPCLKNPIPKNEKMGISKVFVPLGDDKSSEANDKG